MGRSAGPSRKKKRVPKVVSTAESQESVSVWRKSPSRAEDPEETLREGSGLQGKGKQDQVGADGAKAPG